MAVKRKTKLWRSSDDPMHRRPDAPISPWQRAGDDLARKRAAGIYKIILPFPVHSDLIANREVEKALLAKDPAGAAHRHIRRDSLAFLDVDLFQVPEKRKASALRPGWRVVDDDGLVAMLVLANPVDHAFQRTAADDTVIEIESSSLLSQPANDVQAVVECSSLGITVDPVAVVPSVSALLVHNKASDGIAMRSGEWKLWMQRSPRTQGAPPVIHEA